MTNELQAKIDELIEVAAAAGVQPNQIMHRFRHAHITRQASEELARNIPAPALPPGQLEKLIEYLNDDRPVPNLEGVFRVLHVAIKSADNNGIFKGLAALYRAVKTQNRNWTEE